MSQVPRTRDWRPPVVALRATPFVHRRRKRFDIELQIAQVRRTGSGLVMPSFADTSMLATSIPCVRVTR